MGAIVHFWPGIPANGVVPAHLTTGSAQAVEVGGAGGKAAQRIDDDAHLDSGLGSFGQGGQDFICDLPFAEFVEFEVDGVFCPADGLQVGGVEFGAVFETCDAGMTSGAVGYQAEKLNEFFGVQRRRVLVRHGIGYGRAKEIYEEARPEDGYRAHTDGG